MSFAKSISFGWNLKWDKEQHVSADKDQQGNRTKLMYDKNQEIAVWNLTAAQSHLCCILGWIVLYRDESADSLFKIGVGAMVLLYKMEKPLLRIRKIIKIEEWGVGKLKFPITKAWLKMPGPSLSGTTAIFSWVLHGDDNSSSTWKSSFLQKASLIDKYIKTKNSLEC